MNICSLPGVGMLPVKQMSWVRVGKEYSGIRQHEGKECVVYERRRSKALSPYKLKEALRNPTYDGPHEKELKR